MEEKKNELTIFEEREDKKYCSMDLSTLDAKKEFINALDNCDVLLKDVVGQEILIKDFYIHEYQKADEKTGEVKSKFRIILFDKTGKTYATGSYGVFNALKNLVFAYGYPTYKDGVKVRVNYKHLKDNKQSLTLELV